ncbi:Putative PotD-like ABC transporter permease [Candidatus Bealeia paramacronuclearis]|uniref:Putrescine-binding periplasmic protein n=1 Tax=Candidatus Bealeia paramacronuclearis TaxID=1921001 RepID=A0ABZ2C290_9PROT|nr:putative PotD-like ABC transporter permease [Candidatus Bealeia paramacronuclearis]
MFHKIINTLFIIFAFLSLGTQNLVASEKKHVNVLNWAEGIPQNILKEFEAETGIQVHYDVYDSAELMEAKLLTGDSGYDVVGVTVWPYLDRQIQTGIYQPLNKTSLRNYAHLDADLLKKMSTADPKNQFGIPYLWGTTGIGLNVSKVEKLLPDQNLSTWALLFDPEIAKDLNACGLELIDSPVDVFSAILAYLGKDPNSDNLEDLKFASQNVMKVRHYIFKFHGTQGMQDLLNGEACVVQGWSGEMLQARERAREIGGDEIDYVIPQEGSNLWIDAFAVPQNAPHIQEAHQLIDFLLRPEIIARISNALFTANAIPNSKKFMDQDIVKDPVIYPSKEVRKRLFVDKIHPPQFERSRSREWIRVKTGQ